MPAVAVKAVWPAQLQVASTKSDVISPEAGTSNSGVAPGTVPAAWKGVVDETADNSQSDAALEGGNGADKNRLTPRRPSIGAQVLPYGVLEPCLMLLLFRDAAAPSRSPSSRPTFFVTMRLGPVLMDGTIHRVESLKVVGTWTVESTGERPPSMAWAVRNAPLRLMARKSPLGVVGFRFKIWQQGIMGKRWVGRTHAVALPCGPYTVKFGDKEFVLAGHCGLRAEEMVNDGTAQQIIDAKALAAPGMDKRLRRAESPDSADSASDEEELASEAEEEAEAEAEAGAAAAEAVAAAGTAPPGTVVEREAEAAEDANASADAVVRAGSGREDASDAGFGTDMAFWTAAIEVSRRAQALGGEILRAALERQWGLAVVLLRELKWANEQQQQTATARTDSTGRNVLRLCVDGMLQDSPGPMQALERGTLTVLIASRRPYWWILHVTAVSYRSGTFLGETRVGMPRPRSRTTTCTTVVAHPRSGTAAGPAWEEVRWSEPEACQGRLELIEDGAGQQFGILKTDVAEMKFLLVPPDEAFAFGPRGLKNPLSVPLILATGNVVGSSASGVFDPPACARLAAVMGSKSGTGASLGGDQDCGPRDAAALALAYGANPRSLADDGLSPYTAALLGQDPCGLLNNLDSKLRQRIRQGDAMAWAEAGRGNAGEGHADLVAAPLSRGLPVPEELAQRLLDYCFARRLPLLASRVLTRVNGRRYLLRAAERAEDPQWLRVVERILRQPHVDKDAASFFDYDTLSHVLKQIRVGREQFRLLLAAFLGRIHAVEPDDFEQPVCVVGTSGAECPICFEPLFKGNPMAFTDNARVVCPHFLCEQCSRGYAANASSTGAHLRCPECRRGAAKVEAIPMLSEDPLKWFDFLSGQSGKVARSTLIRAIAARLPVECDKLESALDAGLIPGSPIGQHVEAASFLTTGLYMWMWRADREHKMFHGTVTLPTLHVLHSDPAVWFRFWGPFSDDSKSSSITRGGILRAVMRSTGASALDKPKLEDLQQTIDRLWERSIAERKVKQGHSSSSSVSCEEFLHAGGLADLLKEAFAEFAPQQAPLALENSPEKDAEDKEEEESGLEEEVESEVESGGSSASNCPVPPVAQRSSSSSSSSPPGVSDLRVQVQARSLPSAAVRTRAFEQRYGTGQEWQQLDPQDQEQGLPQRPPTLPPPMSATPSDASASGSGSVSDVASGISGDSLASNVTASSGLDAEEFSEVPREDVALAIPPATSHAFLGGLLRGGALGLRPGQRICGDRHNHNATPPRVAWVSSEALPNAGASADALPNVGAARPNAAMPISAPSGDDYSVGSSSEILPNVTPAEPTADEISLEEVAREVQRHRIGHAALRTAIGEALPNAASRRNIAESLPSADALPSTALPSASLHTAPLPNMISPRDESIASLDDLLHEHQVFLHQGASSPHRPRPPPRLAPPPCSMLSPDSEPMDDEMDPAQFLVNLEGVSASNVPFGGGIVSFSSAASPAASSVISRQVEPSAGDSSVSTPRTYAYIVSL